MTPPDGKTVRRERWVARAIIATLVILVLYSVARTKLAVDVALYLTHRTRFEPAVQRWAYRYHGRPVERELAAGRIQPGDPVDKLLLCDEPPHVVTNGRYRHLGYYMREFGVGGVVVVTKDDRVVTAISHGFYFFDTLTPSDRKELYDIEASESESRWVGTMSQRGAVIGGVGVLEPWELNTPEPTGP